MPDEKVSTNAKTAATPRRRRLWLKILAIVVAVLIAVIVVLPFLLPTAWVASKISSAASSSLNAPFSLGGVSLHGLWFGRVSVNNVKIGQPAGFGEGNFLVAKDIAVRVSLLDLLGKKVTVKSLTIDDPQIALVRDEQGVWNYEKLAKPSETPAAQPAQPTSTEGFSVGTVRLNSGQVSLDDRKQNLKMTAANINAAIDTDFSGPNITGSAKASFDVEQPSGKGRFELAAADINVPKQQTPESMQKAALSGTISLTGINVGEALAAAAPQYKDYAAGKLTVTLNYNVKNGVATISSNNGAIAGLVLGKAVIASGPVQVGDVKFGVDATASQAQGGNAVDLRSFTLQTAFANLTASGKASMAGQTQSVAAHVVGTLTPSAIPAGLVALPADFQSSGPVKLDATIEGAPMPGKFAVTLDASGMGVAYGSTLKKQAGKAAVIALAGNMQGKKITADKLDMTLTGGKIQASGTYDQEAASAAWNLAANLDNLNINDYYPGSKGLVATGSINTTGQVLMATENRKSDMTVDAKFNNFTLNATGAQNATIVLAGALSANANRVQAQDLTVNVGGQPVTVAALINTPLTAPNGSVTVRGQEINVDSAMAVLTALQSTVPAAPAETAKPAQPAAAPAAPMTPEQQQAQAKAKAERDKYLKSTNVKLNVQIDRLVYQGMAGTNLVVDGGVVQGVTDVRTTANMFGGNIDYTFHYDMLAADQPFSTKLAVNKVQASEPAAKYMSSYIQGLGFNGTVDLDLQASGAAAGTHEQMLNSITGNGELNIVNGALTLAGMPDALASIIKLNAKNLGFSQLKVPMTIQNGAMNYSFTVPSGRDGIAIDGKKFLAGGYEQSIGYIPGGAGGAIHLMTVKDGKVSPVRPETLIADLAKSQIGGGLLNKAIPGIQLPGQAQPSQPAQTTQPTQPGQAQQPQAQQPQQPATPEEQVIQGVGGIFGAIQKQQEEQKAKKAQQQSGGTKQ